ncbi:SigB/SigF/SigG family RNA polymerase sigma factor [Pseudonocardia eucalypti]|uniref:SigB/SigF/SigG family RNA polymerase sigma factor n=1 Tax=Pseudonocardia eucalypti TaxID=648755 RepID=A0ABP9PVW0_9PSEU|nr:RNA polymerase sigma-B factor [Pseudonocardia eucalypti]
MTASTLDQNPARTTANHRRDDGAYQHLVPLLAELATIPDGDSRRDDLRHHLVTGYWPLAGNLARRYANRGESLEDLRQVALLGLVQAIDHFEPERGTGFLAYAVPTIRGELRRHFRDRGWAMRVPRRIKDLHVSVHSVLGELSQDLGRAPRPSEIAERLDVPVDEVIECLDAAQAYRCDSLDKTLGETDGDNQRLGDMLGAEDPDLELVEDVQALRPMLAELPARERRILLMRFYANLTQTQIAERIGLSQMHVSRLLGQTLGQLRQRLRPA